jgi:hypothetical protein
MTKTETETLLRERLADILREIADHEADIRSAGTANSHERKALIDDHQEWARSLRREIRFIEGEIAALMTDGLNI